MACAFSAARRGWLAAALGVTAAGAVAALGARPWLRNPCHATLPGELARHDLVRSAWAGLDPAQVWDCHAHLAGIGDGGSGIAISPTMLSPLYPLPYLQRLFYLNAGCAHAAPGRVDHSYVERLHNLMEGLAPGCKLMLYAFDHVHDAAGRALPARSAFFVPNAYAREVARAAPQWFEWVCSIHPYRPDAVAALEAAVADGARAVKWLPAAMAIDPAAPACDRFYAALARLDLPLITHAAEEQAVAGAAHAAWNNPLRLRRALEHGVRVVAAHCASLGEDVDLDRGADGPRVASFALFARMMDEPRHAGRLFGDISAITFRNRRLAVVRELLEREDWHPRLLFGTDYPLPGILPLVSPSRLAAEGMLNAAAAPVLAAIREHNPILFDFVLKRHLRSRGKGFAPGVFETRRFFCRTPA